MHNHSAYFHAALSTFVQNAYEDANLFCEIKTISDEYQRNKNESGIKSGRQGWIHTLRTNRSRTRASETETMTPPTGHNPYELEDERNKNPLASPSLASQQEQALSQTVQTLPQSPPLQSGKNASEKKLSRLRPEAEKKSAAKPSFWQYAKSRLSKKVREFAGRWFVSERTQLLEKVIRSAHDPILIFAPSKNSSDITVKFVNAAFTAQTGYTEEEVIGKTPSFMHGPNTDMRQVEDRQETLARGQAYVGEMLLYKKNKEPYWVDVSIVPLFNNSGKITNFAAFGKDVTFRKKAEEIHEQFLTQLRRANERNEIITKELQISLAKAEEANKAKSDFLANMSHEIRTPMNGVLGMAHLLADTPMSEEQKGFVSAITGSAEALRALLNDILDLSRIEAGALALDNTPFVLRDNVEEILNLLRPLATKKGIELFSSINDGVPPAIWGDPARLRQVLINLVGNAIKFTEQGYVRLSIEVEDQYVSIKVEDTGIGIPADKIKAIFDKFTQADTSVTRRYGGTGLGLAITRQLVAMMGGEIGVDSVDGKGSTFWFTLPLKEATAEDLQIANNAFNGQNNKARKRINVKDSRILIVEDTPINQIFARKLLLKFGFERIDLAENGIEALDVTKETHYDLILMDCQMPHLDGYEATGRIREREGESGGHTPIVAMTANAMIGDREKCLKAGMDDYVSKPLHPQYLRAILDRWIIFEDVTTSIKGAEDRGNSADSKPPVDLAQLRLFTDGDLNEERELAQIFSDQAHESISNLQNAIDTGDTELWRRASHRLKGASGNLGASVLSALCKNAEKAKDEPDASKVQILEAISNELQLVESFMMKELKMATLSSR